jgi:hypothetical protein
VRHIEQGVLRRLDDEPLAVPDRVSDHVAHCERCRARRAEIARDTVRTAQLFSAPQLVPDVDHAWARLQRELESYEADGADRHRPPVRISSRRAPLPRVSLRAGLAIGAIAAVAVGTAAAATFSSVFAPTHVAPLSVSRSDLRAIATLTRLGDGEQLGGFTTPNGSSTLRFGTLRWSSGTAQPASSRAQAAAEAGFPVTLPAHLPAGVGAVQQFGVQPRVTASVTFNSTAAGLAGSSVTLHAGPAVIAEYGGTNGVDAPTLGVATMRSPTARSTGATIAEIEAFLLRQPGLPPQLAEEIRLLGDVRTTLPVPVPAGASERSVQIAGRPGVLLTDSSNAVSAVVWDDGAGMLHAVVGLLDANDVLNVAGQLG